MGTPGIKQPPLFSSDFNVIDEALRPSMYLLIAGRIETEEVARCTSIRKLFQKKYNNLCRRGKLQPIEEIPHADKLEYWRRTEPLGDDRELRREACILAYVVDYLCGEDPDRWAADPIGRE